MYVYICIYMYIYPHILYVCMYYVQMSATFGSSSHIHIHTHTHTHTLTCTHIHIHTCYGRSEPFSEADLKRFLVNATVNSSGDTPLHCACRCVHMNTRHRRCIFSEIYALYYTCPEDKINLTYIYIYIYIYIHICIYIYMCVCIHIV